MKSRKKASIAISAASSSRIQDRHSSGPTEEEIRLRAYEIYVERGRAEGQDCEDWFQAGKELAEIIHK